MSLSVFRQELISFFVTKQGIELNVRHVGLRHVGDMTSRTFADGPFLRSLVIRHRMMAECVVTPPVGVGILLTVFYRDVDTVVLAVEVSTSGRFGARAVWKLRIEDPSQFFYYDRSVWKVARLQIHIRSEERRV